ncbi:MAG: WYL domain-containing protein [Cyanobacteria bacterium]|jgi:predicted DNA-binding transcriptional regulator YafY|nr:WYL domain-containing protein [Cyanobacteria bacterium GSL.Bin21]
MSRKGQSITLSVSEQEKRQLQALAEAFDCKWGDRPNISRLISAIAQNQLQLLSNTDWSQDRIQALEAARKALIDQGEIAKAKEIAHLLHGRSELSRPLRTEIEQFLIQPQPTWRQTIDYFIAQQQPFRITYQDAAERPFTFHVLHGQIMHLEKRDYLVCYCQESEQNQDIEALCHNWTLRLDRIQEAAVTKIDQPWAKDLARVAVTFKLYGGLALGYVVKSEDDFVGKLEGDSRRVIRKIFNTFWFFRDIARYWEQCEIIQPLSVRDMMGQKIKNLAQRYEI